MSVENPMENGPIDPEREPASFKDRVREAYEEVFAGEPELLNDQEAFDDDVAEYALNMGQYFGGDVDKTVDSLKDRLRYRLDSWVGRTRRIVPRHIEDETAPAPEEGGISDDEAKRLISEIYDYDEEPISPDELDATLSDYKETYEHNRREAEERNAKGKGEPKPIPTFAETLKEELEKARRAKAVRDEKKAAETEPAEREDSAPEPGEVAPEPSPDARPNPSELTLEDAITDIAAAYESMGRPVPERDTLYRYAEIMRSDVTEGRATRDESLALLKEEIEKLEKHAPEPASERESAPEEEEPVAGVPAAPATPVAEADAAPERSEPAAAETTPETADPGQEYARPLGRRFDKAAAERMVRKVYRDVLGGDPAFRDEIENLDEDIEELLDGVYKYRYYDNVDEGLRNLKEFLEKRKRAVPEEFESQAFLGMKESVDPLTRFVRDRLKLEPDDCGIKYVVRGLGDAAPEGRMEFSNWHDAKEYVRTLKPRPKDLVIRPSVDAGLLKSLNDPEDELYARRDEAAELFKRLSDGTCPDTYYLAARRIDATRRASWKNALEAAQDPEKRPEDEQEKRKYDPVRTFMRVRMGMTEEEIDKVNPRYEAVRKAVPKADAPEDYDVDIATYDTYDDLMAARAQLSDEERELFDSINNVDRNGDEWQKINVALPEEFVLRIMAPDGDLRKYQSEFLTLADVDVRNEAVPDLYASKRKREKAEPKAEEAPAPTSAEAPAAPEPEPVPEEEPPLRPVTPAPEAPTPDSEAPSFPEDKERKLEELRAEHRRVVAEDDEAWERLYAARQDASSSEEDLARLQAEYRETSMRRNELEYDIVRLADDPDYRNADDEVESLRQAANRETDPDAKRDLDDKYYEACGRLSSIRKRIISGSQPVDESGDEPDEAGPETFAVPDDEGVETAEKTRNALEAAKKFGIAREELEGIEGWDDLTADQQKLVLENLRQVTWGRLQEEARDDYAKKAGSRSILFSKGLGRLWMGITKQYQIASARKEKADDIIHGGMPVHGEVLKQLVRGTRELGLDVDRDSETGELRVNYASLRDVLPAGADRAKEDECREILDDFNKAAHKLSKVPFEWTLESGRLFSERARAYLVERRYEGMKEELIELRLRMNGRDEKEAALFVNGIEEKIWYNQYLNTDPDAGKRLASVSDESALKHALKDVITERGLVFMLGAATRTVAAGALSFVGAAGVGGVSGWIRANEELREREKVERRGGTTGERSEAIRREIGALTKKMHDAVRYVPHESDEKREKKRKTAKSYQEKIDALKHELELEGKIDRDFVDSAALEAKLGAFAAELDGTLDPVARADIEKRLKTAEKDKTLDKAARDAMTRKYRRMLDGTTDPKERAELVKRLKLRLDYTQQKLDEGLVRFGNGGSGTTEQASRIAKRLGLVRALARGIELAQTEESAAPDLYRQGSPSENSANRLERFLGYREAVSDAARREYKWRKAKQAAIYSGAFAGAGWLVRNLVTGGFAFERAAETPSGPKAGAGAAETAQNAASSVKKTIATAVVGRAEPSEAAATLESAAPRDGMSGEITSSVAQPARASTGNALEKLPPAPPRAPGADMYAEMEASRQRGLAEQARAMERSRMMEAEAKMRADQEFGRASGRAWMREAGWERPAVERPEGGSAVIGDAAANRGAEAAAEAPAARTAQAPAEAEGTRNHGWDAAESEPAERPKGGWRRVEETPAENRGWRRFGSEEAAEAARKTAAFESAPAAPRSPEAIARVIDARDPAELALARKFDYLESAVAGTRSLANVPALDAAINSVSYGFDEQPLLLQEETMRRLEGVKSGLAEFKKDALAGNKTQFLNGIVDAEGRIAAMESSLARTREAFGAKLAEFGYTEESYSRLIGGNRSMTLKTAIETYEQNKRAGRPNKFLEWLVDDKRGMGIKGVRDKNIPLDDYIKANFKATGPELPERYPGRLARAYPVRVGRRWP